MKPPRFNILFLTLLLAGCATEPLLPSKLDVPARRQPQSDAVITPNTKADAAKSGANSAATMIITENPTPPALPEKFEQNTAPDASGQIANVTLNFDSLPLPAFIQTVYATVLKRNISIDPAVMTRKDLVTLRSGKALTPADAEKSTRLLLKSFGIAVQDVGGLLRIVPDNTNAGYLPEIRRGRASPETPLPLRPVFQLIELQAVRTTDIRPYLTTLFGEKIRVVDDVFRNAVLVSGNGDDVQAALDAIRMLDQPLFKGRNSIRITPLIWSAEELAKRLTEILIQEGYSVGTATPGNNQYPITLLPVAGINSVIVFAQNKETINHISEWAQTLDRPAEKTVGRSFFSYQVKNTDASRLAETIQQLLQGAPVRPTTGAATSGAAAPTPAPASTSAPNSVVVDKGTNTLLFRASGEDYTDVIRLLRELDRPARQVLIEVTVAEVNLTDNADMGVEWLFSEKGAYTSKYSFGATGTPTPPSTTGSSAGTTGATPAANTFTGFLFQQLNNNATPRVILRALAADNKATVLSSPRIIARNGEAATFQVGDSVPTVTSNQTGTSAGLVQTVQYRDTGTILNIKPVVHSSNQVDLEIAQEVSTAAKTETGVTSSPTISQRKLQTKLTLQHGDTIMLGGLISADSSNGSSGIPFLKDIPIIGQAFKTSSKTTGRKELIVLITPYIINDSSEAQEVTNAFRKQLGAWAEEKKPDALNMPLTAPLAAPNGALPATQLPAPSSTPTSTSTPTTTPRPTIAPASTPQK